MFYKSSSTDITDDVDFSDNSDDEQQRISVQVEPRFGKAVLSVRLSALKR
jgi:hypothetical protein